MSTIEEDVLHLTRTGTHTHLTLNRPDKANSLAALLVVALQAAIDTAKQDGTTVLTLRGNGRNFCGGFDLSNLGQRERRHTDPAPDGAGAHAAIALLRTICHHCAGSTAAPSGLASIWPAPVTTGWRLRAHASACRAGAWARPRTRRTAQRVGAERALCSCATRW